MTDSSVQSHSLKRKLAAQQSGDNSQSLELSDQTPSIVQPPDDPVVVFQKFCPEYLVEKWVTWTNDWVSHKINHPEDAASSNDAAGLNDVAALNDVAGLNNFAALNHFGGFNDFADANESSDEAEDVSLRRWVPTCAAELYVFLAFLTYIGLHPEPNLSDYWREEPPIGLGPGWPTHRIHKFMTYRRFKLLFRNVRVFDPFDAPEDNLTQPVSRVSNWPDPVQQAAADLLQPGLKITLEEGMIRFTGRSGAEVTTPRKSIPEGLRIWARAANGYYIRWIFRLPGHRPKLQFPIEPGNASTQSVVLDLMSLSATTNHQAFFDNLLTTIELLGILREEGNVPTGTARLTTGMWDQFVRLKDVDNNPNVDWLYHALEAAPTPDNLIDQTAWKDNALVLFMTIFFSGLARGELQRLKLPPSHARARPVVDLYGDEAREVLCQPSVAVAYNKYHMGPVEIGDRVRPIHYARRSLLQALSWTFFLEIILVDTFVFQREEERGFSAPDSPGQAKWRRLVIDGLIVQFHAASQSRKRFRVGDEFTAISQHEHVRSTKRSPCLACQGYKVGQPRSRSSIPKKNSTSGGKEGNSRGPRSQSNWRCDKCNVALCRSGNCWSFYHQPIMQ